MPTSENKSPSVRPTILATDLDGTLIPLDDHERNQKDLDRLRTLFEEYDSEVAFVTGRHLESVLEAIEKHSLPTPDWILSDVGTSIYHHENGQFTPQQKYQQHLSEIVESMPMAELDEAISKLDALTRQEQEKQGPFKLSYYTDASRLKETVAQVDEKLREHNAPYSMIHSVDPFNGDGLIDLLPSEVSKAHALRWWASFLGKDLEQIIYSGDSGNDMAAFTSGFRTIVVGNASRDIAHQVQRSHQISGWTGRLCLAEKPATSGVLEGCYWFGMFER